MAPMTAPNAPGDRQCYRRDVSMVQRELDISGTGTVDGFFRDVFAALSGGRQIPKNPTRHEDVAYYEETFEYRTDLGDGLDVIEILDYGEYHHRGYLVLTIGSDIKLTTHPKEHTLYLSANADVIDDVTETVVRIAAASGLTLVRR